MRDMLPENAGKGGGPVTQVSDASQAAATRAAAAPSPPAATRHHGFGFGDFLSCLNPLQYLPVVGTLYRAVTGDTIPETVREAGSLVVSGLTGGPIGVAMSVGADLVERAVGFDQEKFSQQLLASIGIGHGAPASATVAAAPVPAAPVAGTTATTQPQAKAADVNLAALQTQAVPFAIPSGVTADADTLNGMELARLANSSYGRAVALSA